MGEGGAELDVIVRTAELSISQSEAAGVASWLEHMLERADMMKFDDGKWVSQSKKKMKRMRKSSDS